MAKSQIIKDLANNSIDIETGLKRLLVISSNLDNNRFQNWVIKELNGYRAADELPAYRKNVSTIIRYTGINGRMQVTNQPLPTGFIPESFHEEIEAIKTINESVKALQEIVENRKAKMGKDLTMLAGAVFNESGIQCANIFMEFSLLSYVEVLTNVNTKLLTVFLELEKEFGLLDDLDINVTSKSKEELININKKIENVVYYNDMEEGL